MTRQQRRKHFASWIRELLSSSGSAEKRRPMLVEPLESRQLLAGDSFAALLGSAVDPQLPFGDLPEAAQQSGLVGEGELSAEGEDAADLVALAKAIADSGTRFFGASWCQFCTNQKELFEDGYKYLPFIEVTNPDRSPNSVASLEGITEYPTWEFPDSTRLTGVQSIATIAARAGITTIPQSSTPSMADIPNVTVRIGSPLHIPVDAYDPNGNPLTITVTSSNPSLLGAEVLTGNRSLVLSTDGYGDMVFELFESRAPRPAGRVIELAEDGFYDGVTFHRVINNFVIQGGDPTGTGAGGSTLGDFDDQYHLDLQHNATGMLSFAKSTDDTNDSQFFITEGPQRFLDFNHSVFGQLVEGEAVREAISNTSTNSSDRPTTPVVINSASIINDLENGVVLLRPTGSGTGTATITVTVSDTEGNSSSKSFEASVVADTANGAPFLNDISDVSTSVNTPVQVTLTSQDKEGDAPIYSVQPIGATSFGVTVDNAGVVTVTPPNNFVGQLQFQATVRQQATPTTNSPTDTQVVTVNVTQSVPTTLDLNAASDSGASDSDNITNATALSFTVTGTTPGATVNVLAGGTIVGSATATSSTTVVTVSDVASLGEGQVLFSSNQTSGGQTSGNSPGISVTLDRTSPAVVDTSAVPASAVVGTALSVDLDHNEESSGSLYQIISGPAGATISATGLLAWTPSVSQLGSQAISLRLTDVAGNVTNQDITIDVIEEPTVRFSLNVVDLSGNPITTIATGQNFRVQLVGQDLRVGAAASGLFAGYVDLLFDDAIIEPIATNPITYTDPFINGRSGSVTTPGLIDELGAFSQATTSGDPRVIAEVTFTAKAAGNPNLRTEAADVSPSHDVLVHGNSTTVPTSRIDYQQSSFAVGADFELVNDAFNFDEDTGPHTLNVLSNDTTTGGAVLSIAAVGTASGGGAVSVSTDGATLIYTPAANFNGAETFTYTAQNQAGVQRTATVTVQVTDVNDPPQALNDTFTVIRNSTQNVLEVLANDTSGVDDGAAETLMVQSVGSASNGGTVVVGSSGLTLRYTPRTDFQGVETFTYTLSDGRGGTSQATVSVTVGAANPPPTPQNDNFTVTEDAPQASFNVLANDTTDDPTETLSVSAVGTPALGGTASVASDGQSILYRPGPNFTGTEIFTYTLRDSGGSTAQGLVTFTVTAINDPPDAVDDTLTVLSSATTSDLDVLDNDLNVDSGETLTISAVSQPPSGNGTVAISSDGTRIIYTPPSSTFVGSFAFTYTVSDGNGLEDTATINLTVENFIPREISGVLNYAGSAGNPIGGFSGIQLDLSGTSTTGEVLSRSVVVGADGSYVFTALPPGSYTINRPALPFLHDSGSTVALQSGVSDGDMVSNLEITGGLRPEFFDIRDFLSSSFSNNVAVAVNADGSQNWVTPRGDWSQYSSLTFALDASTNTLQINGVNASQQAVAGSLPVSPNSRIQEVGRDSSMRLIRVRLPASAAGLAPPAPTPSTQASGEGEGPSSLSAEGEASASTSNLPTPRIASVATVPVSNTDMRLRSETILASNVIDPNEALRRMLGSYQVSTAESVDIAMSEALPALQLQLSSDLETSLTSNSDEAAAASDELFGGL